MIPNKSKQYQHEFSSYTIYSTVSYLERNTSNVINILCLQLPYLNCDCTTPVMLLYLGSWKYLNAKHTIYCLSILPLSFTFYYYLDFAAAFINFNIFHFNIFSVSFFGPLAVAGGVMWNRVCPSYRPSTCSDIFLELCH